MKNQKAEKTPRKDFIASVLTSYLVDDMSSKGSSKEYIKNQIEKFGYDPNNFKGVRSFFTPKFRIMLETNENHILRRPELADLAIAGSTEEAEETVRGFRTSGIIAARYSIFYGGPSEYTGNYPEESGYSLDIPKEVATVKAMLTNEKVLESFISRNEEQIKAALCEFNIGLEKPILITPYLAKALKIRKEKR